MGTKRIPLPTVKRQAIDIKTVLRNLLKLNRHNTFIIGAHRYQNTCDPNKQ